MKSKIIFFLIIIMLSSGIQSQTNPPSKVFDGVTKKTIRSNILNETRTYFIYLPKGDENTKYPVIYLLDGEKEFIFGNAFEYARKNPHIIIGIDNSNNRSRDMFPFKMASRPSMGGADKFLQFILDELQPHIDSNFATDDNNILIGGSASGIFAIYAMLAKPEKFYAFASFSPPIGYDKEYMVELITKSTDKKKLDSKYLYLNYGLKSEMPQATKYISDYSDLLKSHFIGLNLKMDAVEGGRHCPKGSVQMALEFIYKM